MLKSSFKFYSVYAGAVIFSPHKNYFVLPLSTGVLYLYLANMSHLKALDVLS